MGISKHIDLTREYALHGEDGYYIDPFIITMTLVEDSKLDMAYYPLKEYIEKTEITITEDKVNNNIELLEHLRKYISNLREKCLSLFDILDELSRIVRRDITDEGLEKLRDLDFGVNKYGNLYYMDSYRLLDALVYNVKDFHEKIEFANSEDTYTKKIDLESMPIPSKEIQTKDLDHCDEKQFIKLSDTQRSNLALKAVEKVKKDNN